MTKFLKFFLIAIFICTIIFGLFQIGFAQITEPEPEPLPLQESPVFSQTLDLSILSAQQVSTSTQQIICSFANPLYWDNTDNLFRFLINGVNPVHYGANQNWNFSSFVCTTTAQISTTTDPYLKITSGTSTFLLNRSWNYGELFLSFLILLVCFGIIAKVVFDFFFETFIRIKTKKD